MPRFQIGGVGAQCLASVLETNQVLEHLILNGCDLADDGLEPIANGWYTELCVVKHIYHLHWNLQLCAAIGH